MESKLAGKRYIGLQRCSSIAQADTSIDDQRSVIEAFARHHGMVYVDEVVLEGVSGSVPGNRRDLESLIQRKKERDDFDVLLVHDLSRLTRGGVEHVHSITFALNSAGIDLVSATDPIPEGAIGSLYTSFLSFSNQQHARAISQGTTRGSMSSLLDDRSPYSRRPPYGIDRQYTSTDGTPLHIIRNLADGTQLKLHPTTKEIIGQFGRNPQSGVPEHYLKQKQERIRLIPGDERRQEVVRRIFERACVDNWGYHRIALELNSEGIPSPTGKKWTTSTIGSILRDSIYRGEGIANRYTSAIYHMRSKDRPLPAQTNRKELYNRKTPPRRIRPREDWYVQIHSELVEYLPPHVRELAAVRQQTHLDSQAEGRTPIINKDRHRDSSFFLKGLLRSKQGDLPMTGARCGKKGQTVRYYRISKAYSAPDADRVLRKMVPAEPLEKAVVAAIRSILVNTPDLRDRIERHIRFELNERSSGNSNLEELKSERAQIQRKLKMIIDQFDDSMRELVEDKLTALKHDLRYVTQRIGKCRKPAPIDEDAIKDAVEQSLESAHEHANALLTDSPATSAHYLSNLIGRLEVDLESREVYLEIRMPSDVDEEQVRMWLVADSVCKSGNEALQSNSPHLAAIRLHWDKGKKQYGAAGKSAA